MMMVFLKSITLKPSTIVKFVPSNIFMALSRRFSFFYELTLGRFRIIAKNFLFLCLSKLSSAARRFLTSPAALPYSGYNFLVTFSFCGSSISGFIPNPYIAIARGAPCVVPSVDIKNVLLTYKGNESFYELTTTCCSAGQRTSLFLE